MKRLVIQVLRAVLRSTFWVAIRDIVRRALPMLAVIGMGYQCQAMVRIHGFSNSDFSDTSGGLSLEVGVAGGKVFSAYCSKGTRGGFELVFDSISSLAISPGGLDMLWQCPEPAYPMTNGDLNVWFNNEGPGMLLYWSPAVVEANYFMWGVYFGFSVGATVVILRLIRFALLDKVDV